MKLLLGGLGLLLFATGPDVGAGAARGRASFVDEGLFVTIGGVGQWVTLRGRDLRNPVVLIVSGPGVAFSAMARFFEPWEKDFTVVQWDQPGAGATFGRNGEAGTGALSIDRLTRDAIAVTEFVHRRLTGRRIVLVGLSGGSIIGLRVARERPDLIAAYVGSGQITNWTRQEALAYQMALEDARAAGSRTAIDELTRVGPPPYDTAEADAILGRHAAAMTPAEQAVFAGLAPDIVAEMRNPPAGAAYVAKAVALPDARSRAASAFAALKADIRAFDARALGTRYEVPLFFFQGDRDRYTATSEVQAFMDDIQAPKKLLVQLDGGGHGCVFMRDRFLALLNRHVRR